MHPFSADYLLNPMLRKFNTLLNSHTKILMETSSNKSPQSTDIYVAKNSHTSFTCNILTDLGESESIIQVKITRDILALVKKVNLLPEQSYLVKEQKQIKKFDKNIINFCKNKDETEMMSNNKK